MVHVFTLNRSDYAPLSFENGSYFYESFVTISSYLSDKLSSTDLNRLLKPQIEDGTHVKWYAKKQANFKRISELPSETKDSILKEYHSFLERVEEIKRALKSKPMAEQREWHKMLEELFQPEKIILIGTNEGEWAMLWGWDFRNQEENKLPILAKNEKPQPPPILPLPIPDVVLPPTPQNEPGKRNVLPTNTDDPSPIKVSPAVGPSTNKVYEAPLARNVGCFGRIIRFFRWISYRFWALFWLIIYTLLIILLCRYFFTPDCDECCRQLDQTVKELNRLEEAVKTKCDSTRIVR
jgi:hypothetical protein